MGPGHEDREEGSERQPARSRHSLASMGPGHEDREEALPEASSSIEMMLLQWGPVTRTGKRQTVIIRPAGLAQASMGPGHEDREEG